VGVEFLSGIRTSIQCRHVAAPWDPDGAGRVEADGWGRVSVAWELRAPCRPIFFIGRRWLQEQGGYVAAASHGQGGDADRNETTGPCIHP